MSGTKDFIKETSFNTKITDVDNKMHDYSSLVVKTNFNTNVR